MVPVVAAIPFPNLDPILFEIGPLVVRWYGLAYLLGFALAYAVLRLLIRKRSLHITQGTLPDLVSMAALGVVVGGRIGWWLVYRRADGAFTPWYEPLAIWHGGMSFHGGLVGVAVAVLVWSRRNRVSFWHVIDHMALVTPIGLFFGRVANFINAELVGRPTVLPWAVVFPGDVAGRHPSQLYEAVLEGPLLLALLLLSRSWASRRDGRTAALFVLSYATFRFAVEFTREPDPQIGFIAFGWLTTGQLLSGGLFAVGAVLLWSVRSAASVPADTAQTATRASIHSD